MDVEGGGNDDINMLSTGCAAALRLLSVVIVVVIITIITTISINDIHNNHNDIELALR